MPQHQQKKYKFAVQVIPGILLNGFMLRRYALFLLLFFLSWTWSGAQQFDQLHGLIKERDALKAAYDKINAEVKASKSKKPSMDLQAALDRLILKDAEIINEISKTESVVAKELELARKSTKEVVKPVYRSDKAQHLLIDSLSLLVTALQAEKVSLLAGSQSNNTYQQSLQNELKSIATENAQLQKDLDSIRTDKFILARRNWILLYFNVGVAVLLTISLIYMIISLRRRKPKAAREYQETYIHKPRPVTGFNTQVAKVAFDAYDNKLEKIEMLGKLREKGLITDDEFNMQKQQLLNTKGKE